MYRTMKLLIQAGLAREIDLADGLTRYEHLYNHTHHDHLVCTACGTSIEFLNAEIEKIQNEASARLGFKVLDHKLQIYGLLRPLSGIGKRPTRGRTPQPKYTRKATMSHQVSVPFRPLPYHVFVPSSRLASSRAHSKAVSIPPVSAVPSPAIANAVPWSGEVRT